MSTVEEIEAAINKLAPQEFVRIREWFLEKDNLLSDRQMERDAAAGKLDFLAKEIEANIADGATKPLDEVINGS